MRERLPIAVMYQVGMHYVRGHPPWTLHRLTQHLPIPMHAVDVVLGALVEGSLLKLTNDDSPAYLPARDLAEVSVANVLATVRKAGEARFLNPDALPLPEPVDRLVTHTEGAIIAAAEGPSIASLVRHTAELNLPDCEEVGGGHP
jgi:membrane protein